MKSVFNETQRIDTIWPISILALVSVINYIIYFYLHHTDISFFYGSMMSGGFICSLLFLMRLHTKISDKSINFKLFPLHLKWQSILWSEVEKAQIRTFKPIKEYGGWGIRNSFTSGKAYIIYGNIGLQLIMKNGKKILIGTKDSERLKIFIENFKKLD